MADNNNLQLTNTFTGGLDTDTSDMYLKPDKYRFALNIRIITNTNSNTGEARIVDGAVDIPLTLDGEEFKLVNDETIFAFTTCDNHNIMFTKEYYTNKEIDSIANTNSVNLINLFQFDDDDENHTLWLELDKKLTEDVIIVLHVLGYNTNNDGETEYGDFYLRIRISKNTSIAQQHATVFYQNLNVIAVKEILVENTITRKYDVLFYKKITGDPNIKYTYRQQIKPVLDNPDQNNLTWNIYKITENNNKGELFRVFGPCTTPMWEDDTTKCYRLSFETFLDKQRKLYFADGHHLLMSVDINKYNGNSIETIQQYHSSGILEPIQPTLSLTGGNIKSGLVQYAYLLYNIDGNSTTVSPLSNEIQIFDTLIKDTTNSAGFILNGNENNKTTSSSVSLNINIDNNEYEYILIYRIHYIQNGLPPLVDVIYDDELRLDTDGIFRYTDVGTIITSYNIEYLQSKISNFSLIPKVICSKNNYLFAANVTNVQDTLYNDWDALKNVEITTVVHPDILVKRNVNSAVLSQDDPFADNLYKIKSLRDGETYRYGIVLYDKSGAVSAAKWIADITPKRSEYNDMFHVSGVGMFSNPIGIKVKIKNLPADCIGYEIVRCARTIADTKCIALGVISNVLCTNPNYNKNTVARLSLNPFISMCNDRFGTWTNTSSTAQTVKIKAFANLSLIQFISPDISYNGEQLSQLIKNYNCKLVPKKVLSPVHEELTSEVYVYDNNPSNRAKIEVKSKSVEHNYLYTWKLLYNSALSGTGFDMEDGYGPFYGVSNNGENDGDTVMSNRNLLNLISLNMQEFYIDKINGISLAKRRDSSDFWHTTLAPVNLHGFNIFDKIEENKLNIEAIDMPTPYDMRELFTDNDKTAKDTVHDLYVGNYTYSPLVLCGVDCANSENKRYIDLINYDHRWWGAYGNVLGLGCPSLIMQLENIPNDNILKAFFKDSSIMLTSSFAGATFVCNIEKDCNPYGGVSTRNTSIYLSRGNFFKADQKNVDIFDGDTYLQVYDHVNCHQFFRQEEPYVSKYLISYHIPLETNINLALTYGAQVSKAIAQKMPRFLYLLLKPNTVTDATSTVFSQSEPMYQYNTAYSSDLIAIKHSGLDKRSSNYEYTNRIYFSNPKIENQSNDSFTEFLSANYLDVDNKYGEITDLINFRNTLYFWQENAFGQLSVNERQLLSSDNGTTLLLGTGDVLLRYDYISYIFGMKKNTFLRTHGQLQIYWYDQDRKSLISFDGNVLHNMNEEKLITNLVNNSTNMTDYPSIIYDLKYKEVIFNVLSNNDHPKSALSYNELLGVFVSLYQVDPKFSTRINNDTYMTSEKKIHKWNVPDSNCTSFDRNGSSMELNPAIQFIVNNNPQYTKVYDNIHFDGTSDYKYWWNSLYFIFNTPLNQAATIQGNKNVIATREYDYKMAIPRDRNSEYGDRLRGKVLNCTIYWDVASPGFALKYITTKYRISWN